jgi:hypothetical protein
VYLANFKGCSQCGSSNRALDALKPGSKSMTEETEDDVTKEVVRFERKSDV